MKIGLICPYNIAKGGGVQEIVRAEQAELLRLGHDAYIITPQPRENHGEYKGRKTIFVGSSTDFNSPLRTTVQVSAGVHQAIDDMLAEHKFDILHFHEPWVPMLGMQILARSQSVNIATFHAKLPETFVSRTVARAAKPYTKSVLGYAHELTAVSEAAADYVRKLTDRPITIIPNGIDLKKYRRPRGFGDAMPSKKILSIGRLEGRKGIKYLVDAFAELLKSRPDVELLIASDGPDRRKLEQQVVELGIADKVQFLGFISDQEKKRLLKSSHLFCSPALYGESFGVVLLEAMASGLVTVAGDNPGYSSVMRGLGVVSLVDPKHTVEFARRLELLLYQKDLRKLWREWAKTEVEQYGYPHIVSQYEKVFQQALTDHGRQTESTIDGQL